MGYDMDGCMGFETSLGMGYDKWALKRFAPCDIFFFGLMEVCQANVRWHFVELMSTLFVRIAWRFWSTDLII